MENTRQKIRIGAFVILSIAFNFLFWMEKPGINYLIYTALFVGAMLFLDKEKLKERNVLFTLFGLIISACLIVINNSIFSIWMYFISLLLFVVFYHQQGLKSIYYALPSGLFAFTESLLFSLINGKNNAGDGNKPKKWFRILKLFVIPLIIAILFFVIYSEANPILKQYSAQFFEYIGDYFANIFKHYPFARFLLIGLGLLFSAFFMFYKKSTLFDHLEMSQSNTIARKKTLSKTIFLMMDLINEYKSALITLVFLNVLLMGVNALDIWKVWFNFSLEKNMNLSNELHKGVYLLIVSILLSIGVLVYFFRGNINFFKNNSFLKTASYVWIAQNMVLMNTVFVKCFYYIHYHGLAYKRIGVLIFLSIVLFGLILMLIKISSKKSVFYLLRNTTWFAYVILLLSSAVNWDNIIIRQNIRHQYPQNIDYSFLVSLSDQTIPFLIENKDIIQKNNSYCFKNYDVEPRYQGKTLVEITNSKVKRFKENQKQYTWLSWNLADSKTQTYLLQK